MLGLHAVEPHGLLRPLKLLVRLLGQRNEVGRVACGRGSHLFPLRQPFPCVLADRLKHVEAWRVPGIPRRTHHHAQ